MDRVETKIYKITDIEKDYSMLKEAANIIKQGGVVAIPTETVYGLAANALDPHAVKKIFIAKGRPQDNPLIVHIFDEMEARLYAHDIPDEYYKITREFCPGPITVILPKNDNIPMETSAGLDTVGLRIPSHPIAREIIKLAGVPIAAPSANLSGKPSTTTAQHCIDDLVGKVDAIVDGGDCAVGLESTVMSLAVNPPVIYRPGYITPEDIKRVIGEVVVDKAVESKLEEGQRVESPGMKYKHYSPKADVIIVKGDRESYCGFVNEKKAPGVFAMCFDEDADLLEVPFISYGSTLDEAEQARLIFDVLREADELSATILYAHSPKDEGVGLAVYNRLLRSAAFRVVEV